MRRIRVSEATKIVSGDLEVNKACALHMVSLPKVASRLVHARASPGGYLLQAHGGTKFIKLRNLLEHRVEECTRGRSANDWSAPAKEAL